MAHELYENDNMEEARFESLMMGSAQAFKAKAFNRLAKMAAD